MVHFVFVKQKSAYELRISDWSSDVCSSDLTVGEPIVGAEGKLQARIDAADARAIELGKSLAIGDGANDIPMLKAAGLGVAYHAKPKVAAAADARIEHGDVGALLFAQGYARSEWEAN